MVAASGLAFTYHPATFPWWIAMAPMTCTYRKETQDLFIGLTDKGIGFSLIAHLRFLPKQAKEISVFISHHTEQHLFES